MNPHTDYELDLKHLDHWKMGHILTQLAATEDGVNFINPVFKRTADDLPIPGWDLPTTWDVKRYKGNLQKGVPHCGILTVTYDSKDIQLEERHDLVVRRPASEERTETRIATSPRPSSPRLVFRGTAAFAQIRGTGHPWAEASRDTRGPSPKATSNRSPSNTLKRSFAAGQFYARRRPETPL